MNVATVDNQEELNWKWKKTRHKRIFFFACKLINIFFMNEDRRIILRRCGGRHKVKKNQQK